MTSLYRFSQSSPSTDNLFAALEAAESNSHPEVPVNATGKATVDAYLTAKPAAQRLEAGERLVGLAMHKPDATKRQRLIDASIVPSIKDQSATFAQASVLDQAINVEAIIVRSLSATFDALVSILPPEIVAGITASFGHGLHRVGALNDSPFAYAEILTPHLPELKRIAQTEEGKKYFANVQVIAGKVAQTITQRLLGGGDLFEQAMRAADNDEDIQTILHGNLANAAAAASEDAPNPRLEKARQYVESSAMHIDPRYGDVTLHVIADTLSDAELDWAIAFNNSPPGKALHQANPRITERTNHYMEALKGDIMAIITEEMNAFMHQPQAEAAVAHAGERVSAEFDRIEARDSDDDQNS